MKNFLTYILGILLILLVIFGSIRGCKLMKENQELSDENFRLKNSLTQVDTVIETKYVPQEVIQYKYKTISRIQAVDSSFIGQMYLDTFEDSLFRVYEKEYRDTVTTPDFVLPYYIRVWGDLQEVSFQNYEILKQTINTNHIVEVPVIKEVMVQDTRWNLTLHFGYAQTFPKDRGGFLIGSLQRKKLGITGGMMITSNSHPFSILAGVNIRF